MRQLVRADDLSHRVTEGTIGYNVKDERVRVRATGSINGADIIEVEAMDGSPRWVDVMYVGDLLPETRAHVASVRS